MAGDNRPPQEKQQKYRVNEKGKRDRRNKHQIQKAFVIVAKRLLVQIPADKSTDAVQAAQPLNSFRP
jgi:hypothetical protein